MKPRKKHPRRKLAAVVSKKRGWMICGFDTSMSVMAGAAIAYDRTLGKLRGPEFCFKRWTKDDHYFTRLKDASKSHDLVHDLMVKLGVIVTLDEIYIGQEEPWPLGITMGKVSNALKQQAEISGAFLGGLARYGYTNIAQINSMTWRSLVAKELGITTHHSKWKDPALVAEFNCVPDDTGKFRSKQWALQKFDGVVPDWPDIIHREKLGNIPRPEGSVAKAIQPDDRYDALAICWAWAMELGQGALQDEIAEAIERTKSKQTNQERVRKALGMR